MSTKFLNLSVLFEILFRASFCGEWNILILCCQRCKSWWKQPRKGPKMDLRKPKLQWRKAVPSSRLNPSVKVWKNTLSWINICPPFTFFKIKSEVWIKSCSLFREEVLLLWRRGVWTLYWGGLLQRRASFLSSTRRSHAATGTTFPSLLLRQLLFTIKNSQWPMFSLCSWWEDVSWVLSWRVKRTILMRWKGYWRYAHKVAVSTHPLWYDLKCSFPTLSASSALWETPVPDWAEAAEWQEAENNLLSGEGDPAVPLPLSDRPGQPRRRVGQPGNDRGRLCGVGRRTFHTAL